MKYPRLKDLREDYGLTQAAVGKAIHVAQRTYSHYETGDHNVPPEVLFQLADFYDVSIEYLTGRSNQKRPPEKRSASYPKHKPQAMLVAEETRALTEIQRKIICNGYRYTRPGGRLLYSTCTINREENEAVTDWLVSTVPGIHVVEKELSLPYNNKVGFYFCLMQKPESTNSHGK